MARSRTLARNSVTGWLLRNGFIVVLVVMAVFFTLATDSFARFDNVMSLLHAMAPLTIIACGMGLVVIGGKLDISVGSIAFLSMSVGSMLITGQGWHPLPAFVVVLLIGAVLGCINGFIVVRMKVNALIVTLGTMIAFRGLALQLTDSQVIVLPDELRHFGNLTLGPVFIDVLIALAVLVLVHLLHTRTRFGRRVTAIGNSEVAARRIGLPVDRTIFVSFTLSGVLAAIGGFLAACQVGAVTTFLGQGLEFTAVAVVVVGGISLFGGMGSILTGVALGALTFEMIRNGLNHLGANPYSYRLVGGVVIFVAMYADALKSGFRRRG